MGLDKLIPKKKELEEQVARPLQPCSPNPCPLLSLF